MSYGILGFYMAVLLGGMVGFSIKQNNIPMFMIVMAIAEMNM